MANNKRRRLTAEDILSQPDAPPRERGCDAPITPEFRRLVEQCLDRSVERFIERFLQGQKIMHEAAARFIPGYDRLPLKRRWWRRSLEVCRITGMRPRDFNWLGPADEIRVLQTATDMAGDGRPRAVKSSGQPDPPEIDPIDLAISMLASGTPVRTIAARIGWGKDKLYGNPRFSGPLKVFREAKKAEAGSRHRNLPKGAKDGHGNIEAWSG